MKSVWRLEERTMRWNEYKEIGEICDDEDILVRCCCRNLFSLSVLCFVCVVCLCYELGNEDFYIYMHPHYLLCTAQMPFHRLLFICGLFVCCCERWQQLKTQLFNFDYDDYDATIHLFCISSSCCCLFSSSWCWWYHNQYLLLMCIWFKTDEEIHYHHYNQRPSSHHRVAHKH